MNDPLERDFAAQCFRTATLFLRRRSCQPSGRLRFRAALVLRTGPIPLAGTPDTCGPFRKVMGKAVFPCAWFGGVRCPLLPGTAQRYWLEVVFSSFLLSPFAAFAVDRQGFVLWVECDNWRSLFAFVLNDDVNPIVFLVAKMEMLNQHILTIEYLCASVCCPRCQEQRSDAGY